MYVLGIDGGGTKTIGVIANDTGKVVARHTVGATNPNSVDRGEVKQELKNLIDRLTEDAGLTIDSLSAVFAGMSGIGTKENYDWMYEVFTYLIPNTEKFTLDIDGVNALYSGTFGKPGIVNIAGTGSITFGINHEGQRGRVGGWGYLTDDAGSGYAIGRDALKAVFDHEDGLGLPTKLTGLILHKMNMDIPSTLINAIYEMGMARKVIAPLSQLVVAAADDGDTESIRILNKAAEKMAQSIGGLLTKLFSDESIEENKLSPIAVVLTGGVYRRSDWFVPTIEQMLKDHPIRSQLIVPVASPIIGTIAAAWHSIGIELEEHLVQKLINQGL